MLAFFEKEHGKQTSHLRVMEGVGPFKVLDMGICPGGKGVSEVGNGGNVPGITGQGACAEVGRIVGKMGGDNFDDPQGKPGGRGRACGRGLWRSTPLRTFPRFWLEFNTKSA